MPSADNQPTLRFAPSPNGYLHLGHAYSALRNFAVAARIGGRVLLRIEDIDLGRSRPEYEAAVIEDLAWLGLAFEEPVRRQSEHFGDYESALGRLEAMGCIYPCFCSRAEVARAAARRPSWPRDPDGEPIYPGTCKRLSRPEIAERLAAGHNAARRIDMDAALALCDAPLAWQEYGEGDTPRAVRAEAGAWGDAVLARKDIPTSYALAVVVDDALQRVTDIVRGSDLFAATSLQRLLQTLLDYPAPRYHHHALVRDEGGQKLSKSARSPSLRALRSRGVTAAQVRGFLGFP